MGVPGDHTAEHNTHLWIPSTVLYMQKKLNDFSLIIRGDQTQMYLVFCTCLHSISFKYLHNKGFA